MYFHTFSPFLPIAGSTHCVPPLATAGVACHSSRGHHRVVCAVLGLPPREFVVRQARVSLDVRVKDMDLARPDAVDNRRLEVVADGLPLFQGAQLVKNC